MNFLLQLTSDKSVKAGVKRSRLLVGSALYLTLLAMSGTVFIAAEEGVPLDEVHIADFEGTGRLSLSNGNSGKPPAFERSTLQPKTGKACLKVTYSGGAKPGFGNIRMPVWLCGEETLVRFWLRCESVSPKAAMHIWFFERDGDAWLSPPVKLEGRDKTWKLVELPVSKFRFQKRGNGEENRFSTDRMLIGCNFGNFTAYLDDIRFAGPGLKAKRAKAAVRFSPTYTIDNNKPTADWWATLAAEYDPIQFMRESTSPNLGRRGMNESWWTVEQQRVRKMGLHAMRLWFQIGWWEPINDNADPDHYKEDFSGFDINGPRMKSVYRFFEMCRDHNVTVQLNFGWKFRFPIRYWMTTKPGGRVHIKSPQEHAESLVAFLKYIRDVKKLNVITHISLGNEFEYNYPELYPAMHQRLVKEGLRDQYVLMGMEDNKDPTHKNTIKFAAQHPKAIDVLTLHRYGTVDYGKFVQLFERDVARRAIKDFKPSHFGNRFRTMFTEFPLGEGRGGGKGPFIAGSMAGSALAGAYGLGGWRLSDQHLPHCGPAANSGDNFNHGLHEWGTWRWIPWMQRPRDSYFAASLLTRYTRRDSNVFSPMHTQERTLKVVCFEKDGFHTVLAVNETKNKRPLNIRFSKPVNVTFRRHLYAKNKLPKGAYDTMIPSDKIFKNSKIDDELPGDSFAVYTTWPEWPQAEITPFISKLKIGGAEAKAAKSIVFKVKPIAYKGAFKWSVDGGAKNGTITKEGVYTAPKHLPEIDPVIVRATGVEDDRAVGLGVISFSGHPTSPPSRPTLVVKPKLVERKGRRQFDLGHKVALGTTKTLAFKLVNHGLEVAPFTVDVSTSTTWLKATSPAKTVPPGGKESVALKISVDTTGLLAGKWYLGYVYIRSPRGLGLDVLDIFFKTAGK